MIRFNIKTITDVTKTAAIALLGIGLLLLLLGILVIVLRAVFVIIAAGVIFLGALWCIFTAVGMFLKLAGMKKENNFETDGNSFKFRENVRVHHWDQNDDVV